MSSRRSRTSSPNQHVPSNIYSTVVRIITHGVRYDYETPFSVTDRGTSYGTGFFVDGHAHVLTCAHCIDDASEVFVEIPTEGREQFKATVLGICPRFDLGMLRVEGYQNREWCQLNEGDRVKVNQGDTTVAVGFPLGSSMGNLKQTKGIVSGHQHNDYQTDTPTNRGNSGGPMFKRGHVIGIVSWGIVGAGVSNIGFAVPIARYFMVAPMLRIPKHIVHFPQSFGFTYQPTYPEWMEFTECRCDAVATPRRTAKRTVRTTARKSGTRQSDARKRGGSGGCGVHVTKVFRDSMVARSGMRKGDVLCKIDDLVVDAFGELPRRWMNQRMTFDNLLCTLPLGRKIPIEYWSASKRQLVRTSFVMKERPMVVRRMFPMFEPMDYEVFGGMVLMPLTLNHTAMYGNYTAPTLRKYRDPCHCHEPAVVLSKMLQGSFLSTLQIFDNDPKVIKEVNHRPVRTLDALREAFRHPVSHKGRKFLQVRTEDDVMVVLPMDVIAKEEAGLCAKYKYPRSVVRA